MSNTYRLSLLLTLLLTSVAAGAQIFADDFDTDIGNWTAQGDWDWDANGKADGIPTVAWNNRSRIRSKLEGGAALYRGGSTGELVSPTFTADASQGLFVSFYQYFRSDAGRGVLTVRDQTGSVVLQRQLTASLGAGDESSAGNYQVIDISEVKTLGITNFEIVLEVQGPVSFWLVDEFRLGPTRPSWRAFPFYFNQAFLDFSIPFTVDSLAMPYVPFQLVIDFADDATQAERDAVEDAIKPVSVESCVCDRIQVYNMGGGVFFDPISGQPLGEPGDILERVLGASDQDGGVGGASGAVDDVEFNFYNYNELMPNTANAGSSLVAGDLAFLQPAPAGVTKVAILDTGLDLDHPDLRAYLYKSGEQITDDGSDDDDNCLPNDIIGWNYVNDNNNPVDDHGHGTHVAGIVAQNVASCGECTVQIMPYKTHNHLGIGTLFATACATLQASVMDDADVINASWGFYGTGSSILQRAIDTAGVYGAVVVAAAGNDSLNMVADDQFPATYNVNNILSVGTFDQGEENMLVPAAFTNYNPDFVRIFAEGVDITSTIPNDDFGVKSGTSMSTPAVAAAAALLQCQSEGGPSEVVDEIITNAQKIPEPLSLFVQDGNVLNTEGFCEGATEPPARPGTRPAVTIWQGNDDEPTVITLIVEPGIRSVDVVLQDGEGETVFRSEGIEVAEDGTGRFQVPELEAGVYTSIISTGNRKIVRRLRIQK